MAPIPYTLDFLHIISISWIMTANKSSILQELRDSPNYNPIKHNVIQYKGVFKQVTEGHKTTTGLSYSQGCNPTKEVGERQGKVGKVCTSGICFNTVACNKNTIYEKMGNGVPPHSHLTLPLITLVMSLFEAGLTSKLYIHIQSHAISTKLWQKHMIENVKTQLKTKRKCYAIIATITMQLCCIATVTMQLTNWRGS